jgi:hypothetical protein
VVAWETDVNLYLSWAPDVWARPFYANGDPIGADFLVNATTLGPSAYPRWWPFGAAASP